MNEKMTWDAMKRKFPNEWLLITDFDLDQYGHIVAGIVNRHSKNKDDVYQLPALNKPTAFRFTGKSSFSGLRSHAKTYHFEPSWGIDALIGLDFFRRFLVTIDYMNGVLITALYPPHHQ